MRQFGDNEPSYFMRHPEVIRALIVMHKRVREQRLVRERELEQERLEQLERDQVLAEQEQSAPAEQSSFDKEPPC